MAANESLMQRLQTQPPTYASAPHPHASAGEGSNTQSQKINDHGKKGKKKGPTLCCLLHDPAAGHLREQDESGSRLLVSGEARISTLGIPAPI
jgi:hypothetical protein